MTIPEIEVAIEKIKQKGVIEGDDESAHASEDGLRDKFIVFIAENGTDELKKMAALILTTDEMKFARWCA